MTQPLSKVAASPNERKHVVILGSGKSILTLTAEEREFINRCDARIALNKFGAFADISGIVPTHIFFLDSYDASCRNVLQHIFAREIQKAHSEVTFVVSNALRGKCIACTDSQRLSLDAARYFSQLEHDPFAWRTLSEFTDHADSFLTPRDSILQYREHHDWLAGGPWATTSIQPLFHFRGSLTSAINYTTVEFPRSVIWLVGTDFTDGRYFFDDALARLTYRWQDWTTAETRTTSVHASVRPIAGVTLLDGFPVVVGEVENSGSVIVCSNAGSILVQQGLVPHRPLSRAPQEPLHVESLTSRSLDPLCISLSRRLMTLASDVYTTRVQADENQAELQRTKAELQAILESPAWKVTAPLRVLRTYLAHKWHKQRRKDNAVAAVPPAGISRP